MKIIKKIEEKYNLELIFTFLCLLFLIIGLVCEIVIKNNIHHIIYYIAYFFGGYYAMKEMITHVIKGKFEIDFLMIFAAVGAAILGKHSEGTLLLFLFSLGGALEHYALEKAKKQIKALNDLTPSVANVKRNNQIIEIAIEKVQLGDIVVVKSGSKIPVDGVIISGESSVNQAPITGESKLIEKIYIENKNYNKDFSTIDEKNKVYAGTINGEGVLEIEVLKKVEDSTVARLIKLINEAESKKSNTQKLTNNIEKYYVPFILIFVLILCFAFLILNEKPSESFYRAMRVLVGGSPCALAISTPSVILSGIARAAKERILVKGGRPLEELGIIDAIAFDKTGTLTEGTPKVQNIITTNNVTEKELLEILYKIEETSTHPIAKAIVKKCKEKVSDIELINNDLNISEITNVSGKGIKANFNGENLFVGSPKFMEDSGIILNESENNKIVEFFNKGCTVMLVGIEKIGIIGIISLIDEPKKEVKEVIKNLKATGIKDIIMLSGDDQRVANTVGSEIGITNIKGNLLPEDKLKEIEKIKEKGYKIAMVGDGINDAPSMAISNVGIVMGAAGSDVALETADVALLGDKLENIEFAIKLSKKVNKIIKQNLIISIGMLLFLIPASLFGITEMGPTVVLHEGTTVLVVFNALRILLFNTKKK